MLNFRCANCQQEIQSDYQFIGELVQCPLCESVQVVPDPLLPTGCNYHGYKIEKVRANSLLWTTYQATGQSANADRAVVIRIPTRFFLKRVTDFNAFVDAVIKSGSLNMAEFPQLVDRSVVSGKVYFVFEYLRDAQNLTRFTKPESLLESELTLLVARNIATALRTAWDKEGMVHQNLIPHNLRLRDDWSVRITNMGLSPFLIADQSLLQHGFNIWDYHYMSPEFLVEGVADSPTVDIYALGGILYLLNTGHDPYENVAAGDIPAAPLPDVREFNPQAPEELNQLISKLMARSPADRPQGWDEVIGRIDKTLHQGSARLSVTDVIRKSVAAGGQTGAFDPVGLPAGGFSAPANKRHKAVSDTQGRLPQQKPTETVAKLVPVHMQVSTLNRGWRRTQAHGAARPNAARREEEAKRVILGAMALVVLVVLGALGAFLLFQDRRRGPVPPPPAMGEAAIADAAPAVASPPESSVPAAPPAETVSAPPAEASATTPPAPPLAPSPLNDRIAAVDAYAQENPAAYGEILRRYDEVLRESIRLGRDEAVSRLHERIATVEKARAIRIQSVLDALESRVKTLVAAGDYASAIRLLRDYDSEYAEETRTGRIRLALKYEQAQGEANEQTLAALNRMAESFAAQVPSLLVGDTLEAEVQLKLAATLPENQDVKIRYEDLIRQIAEFRGLKERLGDPKSTVASLNLNPDDALLLGLVHYAKGDLVSAREAIGKLPRPLAAPLLAEIARSAARTAFQSLLQNAGFTLDPKQPEQLLLELTRKQLSLADAGKLAESLTAFSVAYGESDFSRENANLVKEVALYCERIIGTKVGVAGKTVTVSPASGEALRLALEAAEGGTEFTLSPGVYQFPRLALALNDIVVNGGPGVQLEGVLVVAANNVELRQITLAKGQLLVDPGSRHLTLSQCRFDDQEVRIDRAEALLAENCLFRGLHLKDGKDLVFRHCTFLTPKRGVEAAVRMETVAGAIEIADSIIFGNAYGILFSSESGARDRSIHHCLWHGSSGLAALQEKEDSAIATRTVVDRSSRLRRFCRTKNNVHARPQFINTVTGDWRLVPGVAGSGKASDGKDMGVVWSKGE